MKKIIISENPEEAALFIFNEATRDTYPTTKIYLNMLPNEMLKNVQFWLKLIDLDENFMKGVPDEVVAQKEFLSKINRIKFYHCIPSEYKTSEDYAKFKAAKEAGEKFVCYSRNPITSTDGAYVWYYINTGLGSNYRRLDEITPRVIVNALVNGTENSEEILEEFWSQDLADCIWESVMAIPCYEDIPEKYVRQEWKILMNIFNTKRRPNFKLNEDIFYNTEYLSEYWGSFLTEESIMQAITVEKMVRNFHNRYTRTYVFKHRTEEEYALIREHFKKFWDALKIKTVSVVEALHEIYGSNLIAYVPNEFFNKNWLIEELELDLDEYNEFQKKFNEAENNVEKLEIEDSIKEIYEHISSVVKHYRPNWSELEIKNFIEELREEI